VHRDLLKSGPCDCDGRPGFKRGLWVGRRAPDNSRFVKIAPPVAKSPSTDSRFVKPSAVRLVG
jgi:hypothetical protein